MPQSSLSGPFERYGVTSPDLAPGLVHQGRYFQLSGRLGISVI